MAKEHHGAIIAAIIKEIERGAKPAAIMAKIGKSWQISPRTFSRLQAEAIKKVAEKREERERTAAEIEKKLTELEAAAAFCDVAERKQILAKIARGEDLRPDPNKAGRPKLPGIGDRIAAVDVLNKMDAVYVKRVISEEPPAPLIITIGPPPAELTKKGVKK